MRHSDTHTPDNIQPHTGLPPKACLCGLLKRLTCSDERGPEDEHHAHGYQHTCTQRPPAPPCRHEERDPPSGGTASGTQRLAPPPQAPHQEEAVSILSLPLPLLPSRLTLFVAGYPSHHCRFSLTRGIHLDTAGIVCRHPLPHTHLHTNNDRLKTPSSG